MLSVKLRKCLFFVICIQAQEFSFQLISLQFGKLLPHPVLNGTEVNIPIHEEPLHVKTRLHQPHRCQHSLEVALAGESTEDKFTLKNSAKDFSCNKFLFNFFCELVEDKNGLWN